MRLRRRYVVHVAPVAIVVLIAAVVSACRGGVDEGYGIACPGPVTYGSTTYAFVADALPVQRGESLGSGSLDSCLAYEGTPGADARTETVYAVDGFPSSQVITAANGDVWVDAALTDEERCALGVTTCPSPVPTAS